MKGWAAFMAAMAVAIAVPGTIVLAQQAPSAPAKPPGSIRADGFFYSSAGAAPAPPPVNTVPDYRGMLRDMVIQVAAYGHGRVPGFSVVIRGGLGLMLKSERDAKVEAINNPPNRNNPNPPPTLPVGAQEREFLRALDGAILDGQYCSHQATASPGYINMMENLGMVVISVDHCGTQAAAITAWKNGRGNGVLPHVDAGDGPLARVPAARPMGETADIIDSLGKARNILLFDRNDGYDSKQQWVQAMLATNYDVLAVDPFWRDRTPLTADDVHKLKQKALGSARLVLARIDLTHARDTDWYWQTAWSSTLPPWIIGVVDKQPGRFEAAPWSPDWREIVGRTIAGLMDLGYDGVVLEGTDLYIPLEAKTPLQ